MTAISLHLGLNQVSPIVYGSEQRLQGCVNDAISMEKIAVELGYYTTILTNEGATIASFDNVTSAIASQLLAGDIFLLTYSGHGSQLIDQDGDESDGLDETWCLYDGQMVDDELYQIWAKFRAGVRIIVVSDSCHSGTVIRSHSPQLETVIGKDITCSASGILLSGCRDNQFSYDTPSNGAFTAQLLKVWNNGQFKGSHKKFLQAISSGLPKRQRPCYLTFGAKNIKFSRQNPFQP